MRPRLTVPPTNAERYRPAVWAIGEGRRRDANRIRGAATTRSEESLRSNRRVGLTLAPGAAFALDERLTWLRPAPYLGCLHPRWVCLACPCVRVRSLHLLVGVCREQAHVSAEQPSPCEDARFPAAHAHPGRSRDPVRASPQGPRRAFRIVLAHAAPGPEGTTTRRVHPGAPRGAHWTLRSPDHARWLIRNDRPGSCRFRRRSRGRSRGRPESPPPPVASPRA